MRFAFQSRLVNPSGSLNNANAITAFAIVTREFTFKDYRNGSVTGD